jgi:hypothetical protein
MSLLNGEKVYQRLFELFRLADERYNSGLFHFRAEKERASKPDELTPGLAIDDKALKEIIRDIYYPESPYEFSVLPADILGQVYEQFLGKVIRLTAGHHAVVEDKPEVKKAGGVYYTPTYIVDYIVKNTVGKLLEGKNPKSAEKIKILDPACGSGSFLLGAYQKLLNWHIDWYIKSRGSAFTESGCATAAGKRSKNPVIYQTQGGGWRLTTSERKRILLNNIYGVDIDPQAVEVTKLSLLLKVLEGENQQTIDRQLRIYHERALPDLGSNIKCGNSLIGPDFYDGKQKGLSFDEEERYRINAFDWQKEFPEIFNRRNPGFDAVIGNPPYIRVRIFKGIYPAEAQYLESRYCCATHVWDIYLLFFERASELTRHKGRFAFIVPIQTLHQPNCESLRRILLSQSCVAAVVDLTRLRVFQGAIVKNCILVCERGYVRDAMISLFRPNSPEELVGRPIGLWQQSSVVESPGASLKVDLLTPRKNLCDKLKAQSWELGQLCYVTFGLRSCAKGKGKGGKDRLVTIDRNLPHTKPYLEGRDITRYAVHPTGRLIQYIPEQMYNPRTPALFETKKIVSQSMLSKMQLVATIDSFAYYVESSLVCIIPHGIVTEESQFPRMPLEFLLGVINSRLETFFFSTNVIDYSLGGGLIHATPGSQKKLIIPQASKPEIDRMVELVELMLDLHKRLSAAKTEHEKDVIQRQIAATDKQIDNLVYEFYNLTEEEIKIVEGEVTSG